MITCLLQFNPLEEKPNSEDFMSERLSAVIRDTKLDMHAVIINHCFD